MSVMMAGKDIREPRSYAQMAQFSIKKSSPVTGGTMSSVKKLSIIISEIRISLIWCLNFSVNFLIFSLSLNADPEHNPYTPKKKIEVEQHLDHHSDDHGFLIHA